MKKFFLDQSFRPSPEEKQIDNWGKEATQAYRSSCSTAEGERIKELITDFGRLSDEQNEGGASNEQ